MTFVAAECVGLTPARIMNQLAIFAAEVTRVAHEVGTKGNLGVTAKVDNIEGTWQEITSNVNTMVRDGSLFPRIWPSLTIIGILRRTT